MSHECVSQGGRSALVEKDLHSIQDSDRLHVKQAPLGEFQDCFNLPAFHTWKPGQKIVDGGAIFKILEECSHSHTRSFEHPRTADFCK